jgi:hypothetical protein
MRLLDIIAGPAVIPDQPTRIRGEAPRPAHEDR